MPSETTQKTSIRIVDTDVPAQTTRADDENAPTVMAVCQYCFGTGVEIVPGKGARPCACRRQDPSQKLLAAARIPPRYSTCSLDTFHIDRLNESQWRAKGAALRLINDYPDVEKGLLLMGSVGV